MRFINDTKMEGFALTEEHENVKQQNQCLEELIRKVR